MNTSVQVTGNFCEVRDSLKNTFPRKLESGGLTWLLMVVPLCSGGCCVPVLCVRAASLREAELYQ